MAMGGHERPPEMPKGEVPSQETPKTELIIQGDLREKEAGNSCLQTHLGGVPDRLTPAVHERVAGQNASRRKTAVHL